MASTRALSSQAGAIGQKQYFALAILTAFFGFVIPTGWSVFVFSLPTDWYLTAAPFVRFIYERLAFSPGVSSSAGLAALIFTAVRCPLRRALPLAGFPAAAAFCNMVAVTASSASYSMRITDMLLAIETAAVLSPFVYVLAAALLKKGMWRDLAALPVFVFAGFIAAVTASGEAVARFGALVITTIDVTFSHEMQRQLRPAFRTFLYQAAAYLALGLLFDRLFRGKAAGILKLLSKPFRRLVALTAGKFRN